MANELRLALFQPSGSPVTVLDVLCNACSRSSLWQVNGPCPSVAAGTSCGMEDSLQLVAGRIARKQPTDLFRAPTVTSASHIVYIYRITVMPKFSMLATCHNRTTPHPSFKYISTPSKFSGRSMTLNPRSPGFALFTVSAYRMYRK